MKRPLHRRALALLWAFAFVLGTVGEGFGLRACPHHDAAPEEAAVAAAAGHDAHHAAAPDAADCADPDRGAAAGEHHGQSPAVHHGGQSPGGHHDGPCTCGAACQAASGAALPGASQEVPPSATVVDGIARAPHADEPRLSRPPHFLPFSLAPPHLG